MRGRWWFAAVRPQGKREGVWVLPKGLVDAGEAPADTALREGHEETGLRARLSSKLGDVRYVYTWEGERVFKIVSFYLPTPPPAVSARCRREWTSRWRTCVGSHSTTGRGFSPTGASATCLPRRQHLGSDPAGSDPHDSAAADADVRPQLLQPAVAEQLRTSRKTATIRLGDKSAKYRKGMIVTVLCGARYGQRSGYSTR